MTDAELDCLHRRLIERTGYSRSDLRCLDACRQSDQVHDLVRGLQGAAEIPALGVSVDQAALLFDAVWSPTCEVPQSDEPFDVEPVADREPPQLPPDIEDLFLDRLTALERRHRSEYEPDADDPYENPELLRRLLVAQQLAAATAIARARRDGQSEDVVDCIKRAVVAGTLLQGRQRLDPGRSLVLCSFAVDARRDALRVGTRPSHRHQAQGSSSAPWRCSPVHVPRL